MTQIKVFENDFCYASPKVHQRFHVLYGDKMQQVLDNWPVIVIIAFFGYRFYRKIQVKKQLPELLSRGAQIVDVRSQREYSAGHNPQSINIPLNEINSAGTKLDKEKPVVLCCASGTRSGMAVGALKKLGFKEVYNIGPWTNSIMS